MNRFFGTSSDRCEHSFQERIVDFVHLLDLGVMHFFLLCYVGTLFFCPIISGLSLDACNFRLKQDTVLVLRPQSYLVER